MSIYNCPNCGKKAFNPLTKALAGQLNSKGKACPNCGKYITNGTGATIFNAVYSILILIGVVAAYLLAIPHDVLVIFCAIVSLFVVPKLVNAFFFRLEPTRRKDSLSR